MRDAKFAGQFYPFSREELQRQIKLCFLDKKFGVGKLPEVGRERKILGAVVPHAGYIYSGYAAAHAYYRLAIDGKPDFFLVLGPNHTGLGSGVSISGEESWMTPLGDLPLNRKIVEEILRFKIVKEDELPHLYEHSIEVQLPFLKYVYGNVSFVPICMLDQSFKTCSKLAEVLAKVLDERDVVVLASSDFSHFVSHQEAYELDRKALQAILKLDAKKFFEIVEKEKISVCGYGPIATMLLTTKKLGAKSSELLKYMTSGDVVGDKGSVVGYASLLVKKE